jgi:Uma2 family endonuclease
MMAINERLMTADELLAMPDDGQRHELVRGELRTMPPGGWEHGYESIRVAASLAPHVIRHKMGGVAGADTGFRLSTTPDTVRVPDLAFVRLDRLPSGAARRGYFQGAPDLAVEVISPNDLYTEVEEKVAEWLEHGTLMVLVVNPRRQTVAVHRPGQPVRMLGVDDTLDGEDVVPGWTMAVRDIFDEA